MRHLNNILNPIKKVLFLGYNENQTKIIKACINKNCFVDHTDEKKIDIKEYDLVISYGYKHILTKEIIKKFNCPILNLHISYLPYNKGAHPNFWSFYDSTPSGVSIHLLDEGIDAGPIIFQKKVKFNKKEDTFKKTYEILNFEIEQLFLDNLDYILNGNWKVNEQKGEGSIHFKKDLPSNFKGWDMVIEDEIKRLKSKNKNDA